MPYAKKKIVNLFQLGVFNFFLGGETPRLSKETYESLSLPGNVFFFWV